MKKKKKLENCHLKCNEDSEHYTNLNNQIFNKQNDILQGQKLKIKVKNYLKNVDKLECPTCYKIFTLKGNLSRHIIKYCMLQNIDKIKNGSEKEVLNDTDVLLNGDHIDAFIPLDGDVKIRTQETEQNWDKIDKILKNAHILKHACEYCSKTYNQKRNLVRHLKNSCKIKNKSDVNKSFVERMDNLEEENKKLRIEINNITKNNATKNIKITSKDNKGIINTGTINNKINNVINIIAFGKEKLDYSENDIKILLSNGFKAVEKTIEYTNFNTKRPEYHNVYLSNIKNPYANIYDGKEWKLEDVNVVMNQLYDDKRSYLEDKYEDTQVCLSESIKKKFNRVLKNNDDDSQQVKLIKKNVKLMMFNKKSIPIKTRKQHDKRRKTKENKIQ
jgi:hypothetical protein